MCAQINEERLVKEAKTKKFYILTGLRWPQGGTLLPIKQTNEEKKPLQYTEQMISTSDYSLYPYELESSK